MPFFNKKEHIKRRQKDKCETPKCISIKFPPEEQKYFKNLRNFPINVLKARKFFKRRYFFNRPSTSFIIEFKFFKRFSLEVSVQPLSIFRAQNLTDLPDFHPCCETKKQVVFLCTLTNFALHLLTF